MKIGSIIGQSTTALLANKGRSFLTVLGIIIGIASVISLYSLGQGVKENVVGNFSFLGAKTITVSSQPIAEEEDTDNEREGGDGAFGIGGGPGGGMGAFRMRPSDPTLKVSDYKDIIDIEGELMEYVTPEVNGNVTITFNEEDLQFNSSGVSSDYFLMNDKEIEYGNNFTEDNIANSENVVIFDADVAKEFSDDSSNLIDRIISIGEIEYKIVGVVKGEEAENDDRPMMRFGGRNRNIYLPYVTAMNNFEQEYINSITVNAINEESVNSLAAKIEETVLENHEFDNLDDADFMITTAQDILDARNSAISVFTNMLTGVAAISLLVGGIGIMNIMLVSVTERTQEIGLRKAVGAKTRHIMIQFLIESILLTGAGGIMGIIIGKLLTDVVTNYVTANAALSLDAVLIAVIVAVVTGIIFGLYPAYKASKLDPVEALRYE